MDQNQNVLAANSGTGNSLATPSELLSSSWKLFKVNWKELALICVVPALVNLVAVIFGATGIGTIVAIPLMLFGAVLFIAVIPGLVDAVRKISADSLAKISFKEQYKIGLGLFWPFLLIVVIQTLSAMGAWVLFIIPGIAVSIYLSMTVFTMVVDGHRGFSALTESFALVRGRWWPVFGRILILALLNIAVSIALVIVTIPFSFAFGIVGKFVPNLLIYAIMIPFTFIYDYKLYESLKATRSTKGAGNFRKWLIAFITIAVIAALAAIAAVPFAISNLLPDRSQLNTWSPGMKYSSTHDSSSTEI